ncbi:MAG: acyl-CoA dehydrogenase family protein [Halioglobus sp.]
MNTQFAAEELAFQAEVREFLQDYRDLDGFYGQGHKWPQVRALFQAMAEKLAGPGLAGAVRRTRGRVPCTSSSCGTRWPIARAARNPLAARIVAQTLIRHGTPVRQAHWLPRIRAGEIHFSLCYSEPEAGSDLASLRLRADRSATGTHYLLNGQKCWQSYAQDMDYLWVLARSGTQESRGRGLSLFICDRHAAGVTVSALPTVDGDQLNAVYFDAVAVPVDQRVGAENGAWPLIGEALADDGISSFPGRVRRDLEEDGGLAQRQRAGRRPGRCGSGWRNSRCRCWRREMLGLKVLAAMAVATPPLTRP